MTLEVMKGIALRLIRGGVPGIPRQRSLAGDESLRRLPQADERGSPAHLQTGRKLRRELNGPVEVLEGLRHAPPLQKNDAQQMQGARMPRLPTQDLLVERLRSAHLPALVQLHRSNESRVFSHDRHCDMAASAFLKVTPIFASCIRK